MWPFNRKLQILPLLLALTLASQVACLRSAHDNPQSDGVTEDSTADFKVIEITGTSTPSSSNDSWDIPTAKKYAYRACLQSRTTNNQLPIGIPFQITNAKGEGIIEETDNLGCINWEETVPFNFSSDSFYIKKSRTLKGTGTYRGSSVLRYAINPWLQYRGDDGKEVVDLDRGNNNIPVERFIEEAASDGALAGYFSRRSSRSLLIENMPGLEIIETGDRKNGKSFKIVIQLKPFIEPLNLNDARKPYVFRRGRFKVYAQLVGNYLGSSQQTGSASQKIILTPELAPQEVDIESQGLVVFKQENVPLTREFYSGQVQLALRVVPIDAPFPMGEYSGLYQVGRFQDFFGKKWVTQVNGSHEQTGFDYGSFLQDTTNFEDLKNSDWVKDLAPVNYSNLEPRFVQVAAGETSTERTIIYRVHTQVTHGVDGSPIRNMPFTILHPKESCLEEETRKHATTLNPDGTCLEYTKTDHNGYLYWRDAITHQYYQREHRILQNFKITHVRSGRSDQYTLALNPWDEGWTFGGDLRSKITDRDYQFTDDNMKPNLLMIDAFRYQTIRFRYVIDEFLTLNVKKAVVMALDPLVQRDTLYRGRIFEPLRDGVYLVKVALVKYYIDPFQNGLNLVKCEAGDENCQTNQNPNEEDQYFVQPVSDGGEARQGQYTTVIKKLLRVQAGRITTPLEFSMRDLRMMSIRSNIMVQLETIDERRLLRDNLIDQKLDELERLYLEINPETMTAKERDDFERRYGYLPEVLSPGAKEQVVQRKVEQFAEQRKQLSGFIKEAKEELDATRTQQHMAQLKRFELVDRIEKELGQGSAQSEYEKLSRFINLPRADKDTLLNQARSNLNQMELDMKQHWSTWENHWDQVVQTYDQGNYVQASHDFRRTYFDYLSVMQTFLFDHGIDAYMGESDYNRLKINNYTQNPVAPIVDLNFYRNKSGLKRRSFIGPCTLVENDNMSEMRPTDTVDEKYCDRIDCGETLYEPRNPLPDNSKFENSEYHDSLKPFASMHVDEVIHMHKNNEKRYEMEMDALSQMGNYTLSFNLEYVSLTDQPLKVYKQGCRFDGEDNCFPSLRYGVTQASDFMTRLNSETTRQLLMKYFYVHPMSELKRINEEVEANKDAKNWRDRLQPLWDRAEDANGLILSAVNESKDILPAVDYRAGQHAIGNHYRNSAIEYMDEHFGSRKANPQVDTADITQWLTSGMKDMELVDALKLCTVLAQQSAQHLRQTGKTWTESDYNSFSKPPRRLEDQLQLRCFHSIKYLLGSNKVYFDGVHFDRRYKILEAGSYEHIAGMNMNINVGIDFGISSYSDINMARSYGINDAGILGLPAVGIGLAVGLATAPVSIPLAAVATATGGLAAAAGGILVASQSANDATGVGQSTSTSVNAATFLVVQKADFEIDIKRHEKCVTLSFGDEFVQSLTASQLELKDETSLKDADVQRALRRGYMVCEGKETQKTETIRESYYYVTQHFTAGDMLDEANLLNHVWLLSLRGKRDFNEFVRVLKSKKINTSGEVIEDGELYDYSLSRLGRVYKQVVPTFPGLYSVQE